MLAKLAFRFSGWVRSGAAKRSALFPKLGAVGFGLCETNGVLGVPNDGTGREGLLTMLFGPGVAVIGGKETRFEGVSGIA